MIFKSADLSIEDYHSSAAISNSMLKTFREKGAFYYNAKYNLRALPPDDSPALSFGRAFDTLLTDGADGCMAKYAVRPEGLDLRTAAGKAWKETHGDKEPITFKDWEAMRGMADSILQHPIAADLCLSAETQLSFLHESARFGATIQCRPDYFSLKPNEWSGGRPWLNDLKTTADLNDWVNESDPMDQRQGSPVWKFGYHRQGGLAQYICAVEPGVGLTSHFLTVIEKQFPYRCAVVILNDLYLDIGWRECENDLERIKACRDANSWPRGNGKLVNLNPPAWMAMKDQRGA